MPKEILRVNIKNRNILIFDVACPTPKDEHIMIFYDDHNLEFYSYDENKKEYFKYFQHKLPNDKDGYLLDSFTYTKENLYLHEREKETHLYQSPLIRFNYKSNYLCVI